jgi:hypothetical protein
VVESCFRLEDEESTARHSGQHRSHNCLQ